MSIECTNTTPISGQTTALTAPVGTIDFSALIAQPDPLDQVDRPTIVEITDKLNALLDVENLSEYPTLQNRYDQFPLTYTEIADYVLTNNVNTFDVLAAINKYDGAIGTDRVINQTLSDLDFHYETNLGKTINEGLCGAFGNALAELLTAFTLLDATISKLNGLNLNDLDPKKAAIALAQKLKIDAIAESLVKTINEIIKKVEEKVRKAVESAIEEITEIIGNPGQKILNLITKMQNEIDDFFSSETVQRIQDNVEAFIAEMVAAFERPTLANVQLIMHKICNFTETIMAILFGPADEIAEVAQVVKKEKKVLDTQDKIEQKKAEDNGAIRVQKEVAEEKQQEVEAKINELAFDNSPNRYIVQETYQSRRGDRQRDVVKYRQPGELGYVDPSTGTLAIPTNVDYVTSPHITADETKAINGMSESGLGPGRLITWSDDVIEGDQWQDLSNSVLAKLLRISNQTGEKYVLRQGKVATSSRGDVKSKGKITEQGTAGYHHKFSGFSVLLDVTEDNRMKTIIAASRAGFTGIGVGRRYLKLHVGNREGYVADQNDIRWRQEDRFLEGSELIQLQAMMTTHRQDGYRKKMKQDDEFRFFDKSTHKQEENNDGTFSFVDNNSILGITSQEEEQPFSLLRPTD